MWSKIAFTIFCVALTIANAEVELNDRPIIAVLGQLASPDYKRSYIAASYVKYLESSGARVVPVPSNTTEAEVALIFKGVNGVFFPGGGVRWGTSAYYKHARYFFDKAIEANKAGDYFPVWGTCLGFETLHVLLSNNRPLDILSTFSASDISIPLNYTDAASDSRLFKNMPEDLYKAIGSEGITYNHHVKGVSPDTYDTETELNEFFKVLSVNNGKKGKTFVSTVEAHNYPIYGTQWHPEKNNFEYNTNEVMSHTFTAIQTAQYMSNFFVNEARKNHHKFSSKEEEQQHLIYNYQPEYTGKTQGPLKNFEQCYYFE